MDTSLEKDAAETKQTKAEIKVVLMKSFQGSD
jgi:hypothetical protein